MTDVALRLLPFVALLYSFLCFKNRKLADWLATFEVLYQLAMIFHPHWQSWSKNYLARVQRYMMCIVFMSSATIFDIVMINVIFPINLILGQNLAHDVPVRSPVSVTIYCLVVFLTQLAFNMIIHYVSGLNKRLSSVTQSNLNLLNGMHEGLLIVSPADGDVPMQFRYCNKNAQKLISKFLGPVEQCLDSSKAEQLQKRILGAECFSLMRLGDGLDPEDYVLRTADGPRCLEQIIIAQRDEPKQKLCVYELSQSELNAIEQGPKVPRGFKKYYQIRVKSIEFMESDAIAIHFTDLTSQVKSMQQRTTHLENEKKVIQQMLNPARLQQDFCTPLTSLLSVMQSMLEQVLDENLRSIILVMIAQINTLVCCTNDIMARKAVQLGKYPSSQKRFDPTRTLRFILDMFRSQAELQDTELSLHTAAAPLGPDSIVKVMCSEGARELPPLLAGDQSQMQLVLFNLVRNALSNSEGTPVRLLAAFDHTSRQLQVQVVDQGRGMNGEKVEGMNKLLESKDQQAVSSSEASGLWFCRRVVEMNEGKIFLTSEGPNKGTTV